MANRLLNVWKPLLISLLTLPYFPTLDINTTHYTGIESIPPSRACSNTNLLFSGQATDIFLVAEPSLIADETVMFQIRRVVPSPDPVRGKAPSTSDWLVLSRRDSHSLYVTPLPGCTTLPSFLVSPHTALLALEFQVLDVFQDFDILNGISGKG